MAGRAVWVEGGVQLSRYLAGLDGPQGERARDERGGRGGVGESGLGLGEGLVTQLGDVVDEVGIDPVGVLVEHLQDDIVVVGGFLEAALGQAQVGEAGVAVKGVGVAVEKAATEGEGLGVGPRLDGVESAVAEGVEVGFTQGHGRAPRGKGRW